MMTNDPKSLIYQLYNRQSTYKRNQQNPGYSEMVARFFDSQYSSKTIVIAGTNGKGSTAFWLSRLLKTQTSKVGLFTSPHLRRIEERIQVNGTPVSTDKFLDLLADADLKMNHQPYSFFETLTLMAHQYFFTEAQVDWGIFEIGVGGRNDPVNLIPHSYSIITNVDLDHVELLGPSWEDIAINKLGIINSESQNFIVDARVASFAQEKKHLVGLLGDSQFDHVPNLGELYENFDKIYGTSQLSERISRWPEWKSLNFLSAWYIAEKIRGSQISISDMAEVLAKDWPGRFQKLLHKGKTIIVSGDHNLAGIESLCNSLISYRSLELAKSQQEEQKNAQYKSQKWGQKNSRNHLRFKVLMGQNSSKDTTRFLATLEKVEDIEIKIIPPHLFSGRVTEPPTSEMELLRMKSLGNWLENEISLTEENEVAVISGSLYLVGQLFEILDIDPFSITES